MGIGTEVKIEQVMQKSLVTVLPDASVESAAKLMAQEKVGSILIVDESQNLLGLLNDRQIVVKGVASRKPLMSTPVKAIMTQWPVSIFPETTCKEALEIMGKFGYRRLPVTQNNKVVGIISISDLAPVIELDNDCLINVVNELSSDVRNK